MGSVASRTLPQRERVFAESMMYHGYRCTNRRYNLKKKKGYIVPSTKREDSGGVDFWVKAPGSLILYPIQITQRGVRIFRQMNRRYTTEQLTDFIARSDKRLQQKRKICRRANIAFVLVRDYTGRTTHKTIAWGDIKALRYALARIPKSP